MNQKTITKRDGSNVAFDPAKIEAAIEKCFASLAAQELACFAGSCDI